MTSVGFYVAAFLLLASVAAGQDMCYEEGACYGGPLVGFSSEPDIIACHVQCQETPDCEFWTHYVEEGNELETCLLYSETCTLQDESNTFSGEVRSLPENTVTG